VIATAGVVPLWAARHLAHQPSAQVHVAISWAWLPFLLVSAVVLWLSYRGIQ
jgi:hypothetical protein